MGRSEIQRIEQIISETIKLFDLDLHGVTVLTEAASGNFYITPIIAALAGAKVFALAKDNQYGAKGMIGRYVAAQAERFSMKDRIEILYLLTDQIIRESNIVTNLGVLRPIKSTFIRAMNDTAIITSMCEDWEVREEDIDREECRKRGIILGAVNEESEIRNIFRYVGYLALKLIMETGLEIINNRYLIISSDKFGRTINSVLKLNGAETKMLNTELLQREDLTHQGLDGDFDAVIIADYSFTRPIVSSSGLITVAKIKEFFPLAKIIHLAGAVDSSYLHGHGITCYPPGQGLSRRMSVTLDYLGIRSLIELHTAGLKVGEILYKERRSGLKSEEIQQKLARHPLCQLLD